MKRFNYASTRTERRVGVALVPSLPLAMRRPALALAGVLILTALGYCVQDARRRAAAGEVSALVSRLELTKVAVARVRLLARDVERLDGLARRVEAIRASGDARADQLTSLGNGVPRDAWLTSIRVEPATIALEGRGTRLDVVGATMTSLGRLPAYRGARLVNVHDERQRAAVAYALTLDLAR